MEVDIEVKSMKVRESGMPDECTWAGFFKPRDILRELELRPETSDVAEFGCGYGTFTMPAAKIVRGKVHSFDIEPEMVKGVRKRAELKDLDNVIVKIRDFVSEGSGLSDESVDYVMLQHPPRRGPREHSHGSLPHP